MRNERAGQRRKTSKNEKNNAENNLSNGIVNTERKAMWRELNSPIDFKAMLNNLQGLNGDFKDVQRATLYFERKLREKSIVSKFAGAELECLKILLNYALNVPTLFSAHEEQKRKRAESIVALLSKGDPELRMKKALAVFGLGIKSAKKTNSANMKSLFEFIYDSPGEEHRPGHFRLNWVYAKGNPPLEWTTDRGKKIAIVDALMMLFKQKTREAVIAQLRKMKTKNAPAYENSGSRHSPV
jgi:hypothetical protein